MTCSSCGGTARFSFVADTGVKFRTASHDPAVGQAGIRVGGVGKPVQQPRQQHRLHPTQQPFWLINAARWSARSAAPRSQERRADVRRPRASYPGELQAFWRKRFQQRLRRTAWRRSATPAGRGAGVLHVARRARRDFRRAGCCRASQRSASSSSNAGNRWVRLSRCSCSRCSSSRRLIGGGQVRGVIAPDVTAGAGAASASTVDATSRTGAVPVPITYGVRADLNMAQRRCPV